MNTADTQRLDDTTTAAFKDAFKGRATFTIKIDGDRRVFGPGELINGSVSFETTKSAKVILYALLYGKVDLFDSVEKQGYPMTVNMFTSQRMLIGEETSPTQLPMGSWDLPFQFQLPLANLPASFRSRKGKVEYGIKVVLKSSQYQTTDQKLVLTVPSCVNRLDPKFAHPLTISKGGLSGNKIWSDGHFEVSASIPRRSFETESDVPVSLHIMNHSAHSLVLKSITLKEMVGEPLLERKIAETIEKTQRLVFNEEFSSELREIKRLVRVPIPSTSVMSPDIFTQILYVRHEIEIKIQSSYQFSKVVKLRVPVVIAGFPRDYYHTSMEAQNVEMLPLYVSTEDGLNSPNESFLDSASTGTDDCDSSEDSLIDAAGILDGVSQSDTVPILSPESTLIEIVLSECDSDSDEQ